MPFFLLLLHPMDDAAAAGDPNPCQPKTSFFLACFGFSGKRKDSTKIPDKLHNRNRRRLLLLKQSAATKTVPLDSDSMFNKSKLKRNAAALKPLITPAPQEQIRRSLEKKVITEKVKVLDNTKGHGSCTNESFKRRIDTIRNVYTQPGSPDTKSKWYPVPLVQSTSFPTDKTQKPGEGIERRRNKIDALMGMSIIMVTLVIILIWGRVCAIICTCTWLYFVPRLRQYGEAQTQLVNLKPGQTLQLDFSSNKYKKRVVFEGFLERRNHSRSAV
ncbi:uncharacterized protein At5g23160-like [Euphorbia lathyris]|uniref:uncharacterized protein At5g23160-like n=1 Tax=Euphorbia lathyris TaxID=212925 RepID=UPI0033142AAB